MRITDPRLVAVAGELSGSNRSVSGAGGGSIGNEANSMFWLPARVSVQAA